MIVLLGLIGYGGHYYWKKGIVNFHHVNKVFEASFKFDEIKERKDITQLKKLIENDRLRESIRSLGKFESDLKKLDFLVVEKKYSLDLKNSIKKTKNSMTELLSFPELSSIIFVLGNNTIVESGDHEELLKQEGVYDKLWKIQTGKISLES